MKRTILLGLLLGVTGSAFADQTQCFRELGPYHSPALLNASPSELSEQARCLVLEYSTWPRAQFIPPAERRVPQVLNRIAVIQSRVGLQGVMLPRPFGQKTLSFIDLLESRSFGLGSHSLVFRPAP